MPFFQLGLITFLAQTVFIRELMSCTGGNEMILTVMLSLWLGFVAAGSVLSRVRIFGKTQRYTGPVFLLLMLAVQGTFILIRPISTLMQPVTGELLDIPAIFLLVTIVMLPTCILSGILFPLLCRKQAISESDLKRVIRRGYLLESLGFATGGILFIAGIQIVTQQLLLIGITLAVGLYVAFASFHRYRWAVALFALLVASVSFFGYQRINANRYQPECIVDTDDSPYGRLDVTRYNGQENIYLNGQIIGSSGEKRYPEEIAGFCLLQHPNPGRILYIGNLFNGLPHQLSLCESVGRIDVLEVNPLLAQRFQKGIMDDRKLNVQQADPMQYIRNTKQRYDMVIVDESDPQTLALNRYYTIEFIESFRYALEDNLSVIVIALDNGENAMTESQTKMNRIFEKTFSEVFPNYVIIPALRNLFVGSPGRYISCEIDTLVSRSVSLPPQWEIFNEALIFSRCNYLRIGQMAQFEEVKIINSITNPQVYLQSIGIWLEKLGVKWGTSGSKRYKYLLLAVFLLLSVIPAFAFRRAGKNLVGYNLFLVSFITFILQLCLIYLLQARYGTIYLYVALFATFFMAGLSAGFLVSIGRGAYRRLLLLSMIVQASILLTSSSVIPVIVLLIMNFAIAFCEGANLKLLLDRMDSVEQTAAVFYHLDSLGAMVGGLGAGLFLIPVGGIRLTIVFCLVITVAMLVSGVISRKI